MPPHSRELFQEGATIKSEKLVSKGTFDDAKMTQILQKDPAQYPGCTGTRCLADNLNDLKAQVAANHKGITLISALIEEHSAPIVHQYMHGIQQNAERSVRTLLTSVAQRFGGGDCVLAAEDYMDDGSRIKLVISINAAKGTAVFDFNGTSPEVYGNINAPAAVTHSAIIYCLRSLIEDDIPLNQGCLKPVKVCIPAGSFLSPSPKAAVVGGNVLTSQRVTDVILRCFNACAASQGDCNNLTFGIGDQEHEPTRGFGYYETIGGGSGAGPTWDGTSGVHTHMTNTRITDSEVFEKRYPVILREFSLREHSAGQGLHPGGNGIVRDIEFRIPVQVSILSERRVFAPYGLEGGGPGQCGANYWVRKRDGDDFWINLGGKNTAPMLSGDRIIVHTPGGGAWGVGGPEENCPKPIDQQTHWRRGSVFTRAEAQLSA